MSLYMCKYSENVCLIYLYTSMIQYHNWHKIVCCHVAKTYRNIYIYILIIEFYAHIIYKSY